MNAANPLYYLNIEKNVWNRFYWFFVNKKHNSIIFSSHDTFFCKYEQSLFIYKGQGNLISVK